MRGDFSRETFVAEKHFSGVLMQQGRVQLDADWNEQQAINLHQATTTGSDVVGPRGAPKTAPGFGISPQGSDLRIGQGRFYVDGILCENETDRLVSAQPDLRAIGGDLFGGERADTDIAAVVPGLYMTYLDVWQRHMTALEDELIRETALGGPDTTTRLQTVWQVRLLRVTDPGGAVDCDTPFAEWTQLLQRNLTDIPNVGQLNARSEPEEVSPDPLCILPPGSGYRRLENQLYRVEVHRGGNRSQARFKWSRDNGTVVSAILADETGVVVNGSVITVASMGKDGSLTFASDPQPEWLELSDDRYELMHQHGQLVPVQSVDPANRTITFAPATLPVLDQGQHPIIRRWDQRGPTLTADGMAMTGDWQPLEDGVQVRFEDGIYRAGDYWTIPARTAIGFETGSVEWPRDGGNPLPQPPRGTRHHLSRLALVRFAGGAFTLVDGGDCRPLFPPLSAISAVDVGFSDTTCQLGNTSNVQQALDLLCQRNGSLCNLLVGPGEDLATALARLGTTQDAMICLRAGTYSLTQPLRIENRGSIQFVGAGTATRIIAPSSEAALVFTNCANVVVRDCFVQAGAVGRGTAATTDLNGALTFESCLTVEVDRMTVECAGGPLRAAACITVRRGGPQLNSQVRIHGCDLVVGHLQIGILLVNAERSSVTDNLIRAGQRPPLDALLQDMDYRAALRRGLISGIVPGIAGAAPPANTNATVTFNNQIVHFLSWPGLLRSSRNDNEWQSAITTLNPAGITSPVLLTRFLTRLGGELVRTRGTGQGGTAPFRTAIETLLERDTATASQGIVFAGASAGNINLTGNLVQDATQCVHVGLSAGAATLSAGVVVIRDNQLRVSLPSTALRDRHGIFVGSCDSLMIESNYIGVRRAAQHLNLPIEGIRIFGFIGGRMIVRHNHLGQRFQMGVTFAPLNAPLPAVPLWMITENVMESSPVKVNIPGKQPGQPGPTDPAGVRTRVRGINDNFA